MGYAMKLTDREIRDIASDGGVCEYCTEELPTLRRHTMYGTEYVCDGCHLSYKIWDSLQRKIGRT
jgi:hypothetical protein